MAVTLNASTSAGLVQTADTSGILQLQTNGTATATIDTSGNVGIGTTSPSQKLDVNGTIIAGKNGSSSGYIGLLGSGDTNNSGYVAYYNSAGTRLGYTGYVGTTNAFINIETDSSSYGVRLSANSGAALAVLRTGGQFVAGSQTFSNGTRLLAYDNSTTSSTLGGFYADTSGYASSCQDIWVTRSSNSAYNFLVARNASDTNTSFNLRGDGNGYADGTWNNNGADYAEYFESATGQPIEVGATVVLDGNKVRTATASDDAQTIIGVVRPKEPGIASMTIGNTAWNKWSKQYITDDFGRYTLEDHEVIEWDEVTTDEDGKIETTHKSYESHMIPEGVVIPANAIRKTKDEKGNKFNHYKLNPDFDPTKEYIPREERPEWLIIGLVGQVPILNAQPVNNRWVKMRDISANVSEYLIR
jgi:hypothetical protein